MCRKIIRPVALLLVILFSISLNVACRKAGVTSQSITYNLGTEPETIDPALNNSVNGANVILANFEGLMRLDKNNRAIPGIAESYTKDSDIKYTFKLREAKWSDGKRVTARDFEYAWKRVLAPETSSQYAYQLYCIKNGEAYNKRQITEDNVGIKVINDKTIEVTLEEPTPYFLELLSLPAYMPVREDIVKIIPDRWDKKPFTYIGNGPFRMTSWNAKDTIELVKNENYYDAGRVRLNKVVFRMVEEPNVYFTAWETGEIDIIESAPYAELARLKSKNELTTSPYLGTYFYAFNCNKKPLDDKRVRKALAYAIDRFSLIQNVIKNDSLPALALVPNGIPDADISKDFRDVGGAYYKVEGQVAEARKLLTEAGYPEGKGFPTVNLVYNNTSYHSSIAQNLQDMWEKNLGITVNLKVQDWKDIQKSRIDGDYDIVRNGWITDFADPISFLNLFVTGEGSNNSKYSNKIYDSLVMRAKRENDHQKRMKYLHDAENVLMDDMPILPIFFYTDSILSKPYVKGIIKSPLGFVYFDQAYVEER